MDELDSRGEFHMGIAAIAELARRGQRDERPEPLAAGIDEMLSDLGNERGLAQHAAVDDVVNRGEIGAHQGGQPLHRVDTGRQCGGFAQIRAHSGLPPRSVRAI